MTQEKFIIDVCCGGRMFWKNKNHPNVIYQDIRKDVLPLKEQYGMNFSVEPDVIGDFRKMVFADKSFKMVIFDPPHLMLNKTAWMAKKYGTLKDTDYKADIQAGFKECWRVLDDYGTLIFKWNDQYVTIKEIKPFFPDEPLIFNRIGTKGKSTYWFVFMKIPKNIIAQNKNSSQTKSARSSNEEGFNKDYQETSNEVSQIPNGTSDNPDIKYKQKKYLK